MEQIYWHKLTRSQQHEILERGAALHKTWGGLGKRFKQPDWCNYPDALEGEMGCWSLLGVWMNSSEIVFSREFCKDCDCYVGNESEDE